MTSDGSSTGILGFERMVEEWVFKSKLFSKYKVPKVLRNYPIISKNRTNSGYPKKVLFRVFDLDHHF